MNKKRIITISLVFIMVFTLVVFSSSKSIVYSMDLSEQESVLLGDKDRIIKPIEMNVATCWATEAIAANEVIEFMRIRIADLSGGKITLKTHFGTLGGERQIIESTMLNSIQGIHVTTGPLGAFVPITEIFMIPFLFKDFGHAFATVRGLFGQRINELLLEKNVRILGWYVNCLRGIVGKGDIVMTVDDLKGKKIRIMESNFLAKLYNHYGAIPTPMAFTETFMALQQGALDGEQTAAGIINFGYESIIDWFCDLQETYQLAFFAVNEDWWQSLPKEARQIITQAEIEAENLHQYYAAEIADTDKQSYLDHGLKYYEPNRDAFREKAMELYPEFRKMLGDDEGWVDWIVNLGELYPYTFPRTNITIDFY